MSGEGDRGGLEGAETFSLPRMVSNLEARTYPFSRFWATFTRNNLKNILHQREGISSHNVSGLIALTLAWLLWTNVWTNERCSPSTQRSDRIDISTYCRTEVNFNDTAVECDSDLFVYAILSVQADYFEKSTVRPVISGSHMTFSPVILPLSFLT